MGDNQNQALWVPDPANVAATNMAAFTDRARILSGRPLESQAALHEWSVHSPVPFWRLVWEFCEVLGDQGVDALGENPVRLGHLRNLGQHVGLAGGTRLGRLEFLGPLPHGGLLLGGES